MDVRFTASYAPDATAAIRRSEEDSQLSGEIDGRKTKIVATVGPASWDVTILKQLILSGVDIFRVNAAHNNVEGRRRIVESIREAVDATRRHVGILQDLAGVKPRTGPLPDGQQVHLKRDASVRLITGDAQLTDDVLSIDEAEVVERLRPGQRVLMADGLLELIVQEADGKTADCQVIRGGYLRGRQGVTVPGAPVDQRILSADECRDIRFAAEADLEYLGMSFVTKAADVELVRSELQKYGGRSKIIAKIERAEALENIDAIAQAADALMVARGDLGVQLPPEDVPLAQKRIIQIGHRRGRPVITATQMLESMIYQPIPTRAETSDVANAVLDGTDAVMLSAETATGEYPLEAVAMMDRVVSAIERGLPPHREPDTEQATTIASTIARAAFDITQRSSLVNVIGVLTRSGFSAREVARERPDVPIVALTNDKFIANQLALIWGVKSIVAEYASGTEALMQQVSDELVRAGDVREGDHVLIVGSLVYHNEPGHTDALHLRRIG
jgi:pyruvate kinase